MIKLLLLAVVPFMTQHRNVVPKTEVSTNFYGSVTGVVTTAYIQEHSSIVLPEKWALANVTNANGKSVRASDVGALGNSGSQTLNQSYGGLSVTFDAEGALYKGQYAPSKWSITKEVNDQYYYVQFFGFNGTNYPSFNLFDGESDFYVRLPRKEGTLALQSDVESKADKVAYATDGNLAAFTADGNLADSGKKASDFLPASSSFAGIWDVYDATTFRSEFSVGPNGDILGVSYDHGSLYKFGDTRWYYGETASDANEIAVKGDISATNPTFSSAVLAVGLNIDTNSVAVLNEIAATFGGFPIEGTATTVGGLLAALAAAVAWLKKNKVQTLKLEDGSVVKTAENGVAKLDDFFTGSNSLLTGTIDDRLPILLEKKTDSFVAEDGHAYAVTMTGTVTITMPTTTEGKAAIFQARFSAEAQQSVEFSTTALVKFDGADCGIVKAGKDALLSAMWNGEAWDLVWKNQA